MIVDVIRGYTGRSGGVVDREGMKEDEAAEYAPIPSKG